jgi:hypothetical protein
VGAWLLTWWRAGDVATESEAVWLIRSAIVIGALGAMFALDDPSYDVTEATVGSRRSLMRGRLGTAVVVTGLALVPAVVAMRTHLSADAIRGLLIEAMTLIALMSAFALTLQRRWRVLEPAQYLFLVAFLMAVADQITVGRWPLLLTPGPGWEDAHRRWLALGALALLACLWQLRDPASRRRAPQLRWRSSQSSSPDRGSSLAM